MSSVLRRVKKRDFYRGWDRASTGTNGTIKRKPNFNRKGKETTIKLNFKHEFKSLWTNAVDTQFHPTHSMHISWPVNDCAGIRSGKEKEEGEMIKHFLFLVETKMETKKAKLTLKRSEFSWSPGYGHFSRSKWDPNPCAKRRNSGCSSRLSSNVKQPDRIREKSAITLLL